MVTVKIKENSKQAKLFLDYIKTLSFVEFVESSSDKKASINRRNEYQKLKLTTNQKKHLSLNY